MTRRWLLALPLVALLCAPSNTALVIQDEGANVSVNRPAINFSGGGVACADDVGNNRTNCAVAAPGIATGFIQVGNGIADGADILTVTDSSSVDFTTTDNPEDLTAVALCGGLISCPVGSAITTSMATARLLGRTTAGAGVVEQLTAGTLLSLSGGSLAVDDSDLMRVSAYDILATGYAATYAGQAGFLDWDEDGIPEIICDPGVGSFKCEVDSNDDATPDLTVSNLFGSIFSNVLPFASSEGFGAGNGSSSTAVNSSCMARDSTANVDRLFEDKDCDVMNGATPTPEANEGMLADIIANNTSTHTLASTTGTQVTGLKLDLDGLKAYEVVYSILSQSSDVTVGLAYGITFTGTATFNCERSYVANAAQTIASGTGGPLTKEVWITATASTTAPNLGPNTGGVQTANTTALEYVRCSVVVTAAGDLQFWHASETNTNTSVMINSTARATRFN